MVELRKALILLLILSCTIVTLIALVYAEPSWVMWSHTYGGTGEESMAANGVHLVRTSGGGFALVGGTYSLGAGGVDFWLVKTDANGDMEWNRTYGGADHDIPHSLIQTADGGFALCGEIRLNLGHPDFWFVKTDTLGNEEWNRTYGGANEDFASSLVQTSDGGYAIVGNTLSFGAGDYDFWLIKTNEQGVPEFSSWIVFPLLFVATFLVIVLRKRLLNQQS
jgi:hypothetical protein